MTSLEERGVEGAYLFIARKRTKKTIKTIALEMKVSIPTVNFWELGYNLVSKDNIPGIPNAYVVTMDEFRKIHTQADEMLKKKRDENTRYSEEQSFSGVVEALQFTSRLNKSLHFKEFN